jgi:hypothetical protein
LSGTTGPRVSGLLWPGEDARRSIDKVRGGASHPKKIWLSWKLGVARSEVRALSGAGINDLIALETELGGSENRKSYIKAE